MRIIYMVKNSKNTKRRHTKRKKHNIRGGGGELERIKTIIETFLLILGRIYEELRNRETIRVHENPRIGPNNNERTIVHYTQYTVIAGDILAAAGAAELSKNELSKNELPDGELPKKTQMTMHDLLKILSKHGFDINEKDIDEDPCLKKVLQILVEWINLSM